MIKQKINYSLVLCEGYKDSAYYTKIIDYIMQNELKNRIFVYLDIEEGKRNWLLQNAKLFVTPSLYEGYGRTPVEAAIYGIPVISTKEKSLFEVTKGLVFYVEDTKSENELASLIQNVLSCPLHKIS